MGGVSVPSAEAVPDLVQQRSIPEEERRRENKLGKLFQHKAVMFREKCRS